MTLNFASADLAPNRLRHWRLLACDDHPGVVFRSSRTRGNSMRCLRQHTTRIRNPVDCVKSLDWLAKPAARNCCVLSLSLILSSDPNLASGLCAGGNGSANPDLAILINIRPSRKRFKGWRPGGYNIDDTKVSESGRGQNARPFGLTETHRARDILLAAWSPRGKSADYAVMVAWGGSIHRSIVDTSGLE